jgi:hypothetical protein
VKDAGFVMALLFHELFNFPWFKIDHYEIDICFVTNVHFLTDHLGWPKVSMDHPVLVDVRKSPGDMDQDFENMPHVEVWDTFVVT